MGMSVWVCMCVCMGVCVRVRVGFVRLARQGCRTRCGPHLQSSHPPPPHPHLSASLQACRSGLHKRVTLHLLSDAVAYTGKRLGLGLTGLSTHTLLPLRTLGVRPGPRPHHLTLVTPERDRVLMCASEVEAGEWVQDLGRAIAALPASGAHVASEAGPRMPSLPQSPPSAVPGAVPGGGPGPRV